VLSIELPPDIVAAINRQTEQYYMIQEYKFRVEREAEESKRKQIEADGIAAFQKTVSQGISESYLRWRGIEATLQLALSPNSKIVVIGSGKDGLPIILGNVDTPVTPGAPPPAGASGAAPPPGASAPAANAPPNAPAPPGSKPPSGTSGEATPPASDKTAATAPANDEGEQATSPPLSLADVQAILSRLSGGLYAPGSASSSGAAAQSKQ
jgi:prohibitin 2